MASETEKGKYASPEGSKMWEYLAIFCCTMFSLCIGTVVGWNSPSVVKLMEQDSPIPVTPSDAATLVAVVAVGHMLAPPLNTLIVDRFGRKNTILLSGLPLVISWGLIMVANHVMVLYVARFMAGITLGLCICVTPMYVGEISSVDTRGAGGALIAIMYNLGILVSFVIASYLSILMTAGTFLAITIGIVAAFWFMPESPYFLGMVGRMDEAEEVLEKLRGKPDVSEDLDNIVATLSAKEKSEKKEGQLMDVFLIKPNRRAFLIIFFFILTHHAGGFLVVLTYGQLIFKETASPVADHHANIVIGVTQVISAVIITFLVDKLGRRPLILFSGFVSGLCNLMIGVFFYAKDYLDVDVSPYSLTPFVASMALVFGFNCGLLPLQIILVSEVFSTEIKAIGNCVLAIAGGLLGTIVCKFYILFTITWGYGHGPPFLAFFVVVWASTVVILYLTPETKGKTFVEIQRELNK